jgi:hypothetical protein
MMVHGFDMYRVFHSAPGDLGIEMETCRGAVSQVNQDVAMASKVLLVSVGLLSDDQITGFRAAVADNIRQCSYFMQVFEDDWGPKNLFRKMFLLALECRDDPGFPMREVIVCLKAAPKETDPEILAFRKELEDAPGVRVLHFHSGEDLKPQLVEVASGWARTIIEAASPEAAGATTTA